MPGWYIHMDVARKALDILETNDGARELFAAPGPSATDLTELAHKHPAYAALGAIGPDIFFLLPDFKPPLGQALWGAADLVKKIYEGWDENFQGPYQDQLGPIAMNTTVHFVACDTTRTTTTSKRLCKSSIQRYYYLLADIRRCTAWWHFWACSSS